MFEDYDPDDLEVRVAEMMVATADQSDAAVEPCVQGVLQLLRDRMKMDVVFVSEFTGGRRVFRQVAQGEPAVVTPGDSDPLEASWCQRVVDGRLPGFVPDAGPLQAAGQLPAAAFPVGTHISTPVVLGNGEVYGTLCCFSFAPVADASEADLKRLRFTAELTAQRLDRARQSAGPELTLAPIEPLRRRS